MTRTVFRLSTPALLVAAAVLASPMAAAAQQAGGEAYLPQVSATPQPEQTASGPEANVRTSTARTQSWLAGSAPLDDAPAALRLLDALSGGPDNIAVVVQEGMDNRAHLEQYGAANVAAIVQTGDANLVALLQDGNHNAAAVSLTGSQNQFSLVQRGDDNLYVLDFVGDGLDHSVLQEGTGLRAVQVGVGSLPFLIEQRGVGLEIRIEHIGPR